MVKKCGAIEILAWFAFKHEQETVILTSFNGTNRDIPSPIRKVDPTGKIGIKNFFEDTEKIAKVV